jgi:hypothetical protein
MPDLIEEVVRRVEKEFPDVAKEARAADPGKIADIARATYEAGKAKQASSIDVNTMGPREWAAYKAKNGL